MLVCQATRSEARPLTELLHTAQVHSRAAIWPSAAARGCGGAAAACGMIRSSAAAASDFQQHAGSKSAYRQQLFHVYSRIWHCFCLYERCSCSALRSDSPCPGRICKMYDVYTSTARVQTISALVWEPHGNWQDMTGCMTGSVITLQAAEQPGPCTDMSALQSCRTTHLMLNQAVCMQVR